MEPRRFCVALQPSECVYNRCVSINLMKLRSRTVLHAVDRDNKFSAAQFLPKKNHISNLGYLLRIVDALLHFLSIYNCNGPWPSVSSADWKSLLPQHENKSQKSGLESHNVLGIGEKYHGYRRNIHEEALSDSPSASPKFGSFIAVKVCNNYASINDFSPTLLVFMVVPRLPLNPRELPTHVKRMKAIT